MRLSILASFTLTLLICLDGKAEYRAFILHLFNSEKQQVRLIETTLDPDQYRTLYPLSPHESLTYVETWKCKGRTDFFKPICAKPTKAQN